MIAAGVVVVCAACSPAPEPSPDPEPPRILLGGRGSEDHVLPPRLVIREGQVVEFVTVDGRVRTVSFDLARLSAAALDFLARTDQLDSPPLVERGSVYAVSFRGAPPGPYPFLIESNGAPTPGVVIVQ